MLCTVSTQRTSRQDAITTVRLYLATRSGRNRPSSGQLRTTLRYSKNSILFFLYLNIVLSWPEDSRLWPKHFYCTLILFLVGLKVAGYGRNIFTVKVVYYF